MPEAPAVTDTNSVREVGVFVDELNQVNLGFEAAIPAETDWPAYTLRSC
jgi:hypothetical protein